MNFDNKKIAIIGLGYAGLPLAGEFGKKRAVVGFDINAKHIAELQADHDHTLETAPEELQAASHLRFTTQIEDLRACNCFIFTVPTPIDERKRPDLTPVIEASATISKVLKKDDIVIYESTSTPAPAKKAVKRLGYAATQRIGKGLELAMPWLTSQHPTTMTTVSRAI